MSNTKKNAFGKILRKARLGLNWTQGDLARKIRVSTQYIGHLESGKRHPSDKTIQRLADTLRIDRRRLFFEAKPETQAYLDPPPNPGESVWDQFSKDENLRRQNDISPEEMEMLSRAAMLGQASSPEDFIYILNTVRQAIRK
jgi:transcriptional regulator with XRE-family HTH domain